jgi:hypothetical protein
MKKSRFSCEQKIHILGEYRSGETTEEVSAKHNQSPIIQYH